MLWNPQKESSYECEMCGELHREEEIREVDGAYVCKDCLSRMTERQLCLACGCIDIDSACEVLGISTSELSCCREGRNGDRYEEMN